MSQRFPVYNLKWVNDIFKYDESFLKSNNEESDKRYVQYIKVGVQYPGKLQDLHNHFYLKE